MQKEKEDNNLNMLWSTETVNIKMSRDKKKHAMTTTTTTITTTAAAGAAPNTGVLISL